MEIKRCGSRPSGKGPAEYFTGTVRIDPLIEVANPPGLSGGSVTFEPSARTLAYPSARSDVDGYVRRGPGAVLGRADRGNSARRCRLDSSGREGRHGASPTVAMTHIAIQEGLDGRVGDWLEKVSDQQYNG